MPVYRATPLISGWIVRWDTRLLVRAYDQYPELRVEAGKPLVLRCREPAFTAGVRLDGSDRIVSLELVEDSSP